MKCKDMGIHGEIGIRDVKGVLQNALFYNLTPIPTATAVQALLLHIQTVHRINIYDEGEGGLCFSNCKKYH